MQQSPQQNRQFAGEQSIRRFPQNNQPVQGYEQQGAPAHRPLFQTSQSTVPARQGQTIKVALSPELQSAICKDCPYRTAAEDNKQKKSRFFGRRRDHKKRTPLWVLLLALIGLATVIIQGLRYVILPLVDYFFQLTGGAL